ncbi:MAG: arylsulfatase [Akkermansiaceae bacterium]
MKASHFLSFLCLTVLSASLTCAKISPPNVVLIFADDLGYGDLGCYGATKLKTPNIDKLAAEGKKFTDAHSSSAVCTPSRYGLLTGEYPFRGNGGKGIWGPAPVTSPLLIPTDTLTIADIFKKSGYDTAVFGKWHLGFGKGSNKWQEPLRPGPQDLGFDYYFGMPVVNSAPPYVYVENDRIVGSDPTDPIRHVGRNAKSVTAITPIRKKESQRSPNQFSGAIKAHKLFNDYEVGTKLTEKATSWIKNRQGKPFFCYFATTNVHHPFTPAKRFQGTSESGVYGDFVHELDWIVGEVRKSLEEAGVADNTLIIFTSDNGGMFNLGGRAAAKLGHKINGDLLGSKFGIWEGGHRIPFIAWWPEKIKASTVSNQLTISVDMLATFAALTGQKLENSKDSINMLPALTGNPEKPLRTEMFITPHKASHMAYRKGKWMYIPARSDGGFKGSKPNQHAWGGAAVTKLVGTPNSDIQSGVIKKDAPPAQLYDLETDVNQTQNLYRKHPEVVAEMAAVLKKIRPQKEAPKRPKPKK